jgi:hypothetical protein
MKPCEALEEAISSAFWYYKFKQSPGEVVSKLRKEIRDVLKELTSKNHSPLLDWIRMHPTCNRNTL